MATQAPAQSMQHSQQQRPPPFWHWPPYAALLCDSFIEGTELEHVPVLLRSHFKSFCVWTCMIGRCYCCCCCCCCVAFVSLVCSLKLLHQVLSELVADIDAYGASASGLSRFAASDVGHLRALLPLLQQSAQVTELAMSIQKPEQLPDVLQRTRMATFFRRYAPTRKDPDRFFVLFCSLNTEWLQLLRNMPVDGKPMLIAGGWLGLLSDGAVMHLVYRTASDAFSFVTCNTGNGLQYHSASPCNSDETPPKVKYATAMRIDDVPLEKMCDAGFWLMLFTQVRLLSSALLLCSMHCL